MCIRDSFFVDGFHLFGRIRSDEDAVVLQQQDCGLLAEFRFVGVDPVFDFFEEHVTRVGVRKDVYKRQVLVKADITTNKNMVPFDSRSPFQTSGIRVGRCV